ncbi:hypothetical protein LSH36_395g02051 [Paralvinella palmiformis]|uniref:UspA domain-containing protein n=1 Tax=Paralvinella palmiformis TaxID=53620 RepID=A0AAD9JE53_9ANNE|nr:hypothetical protein LSH36_395g02051 [Paralvinella palmiformis]
MKRVLIPIDWSENAERAFDWYIYQLHKKGTQIILMHFIEATKQKEIEQKEVKMLELQEVYETRLLQLKIDHQWVTGVGTNPGEHIVRVSLEHDVDMIVMGARGLGKLKRTILGSVSDHVLSKTKVPVLICKVI